MILSQRDQFKNKRVLLRILLFLSERRSKKLKFVSLEKKDGWRKEINHLEDYNRWGEKDVNRTRGVPGVRENVSAT
jgi:hypothetical protein